VLGKRRAEAAGRRQTEVGGGASRDVDGVPVAGVPEGGGEVARQLLRDDVVLMGCSSGAERRRSGGTTARRAAAEARVHRHSGPVVLVQESEIGRAGEHQWVAGVLEEHWVGNGKRRRRLSTVSRGSSGAPARRGARGERRQCKCECVKARGSALGAREHASSRGEGTASESWCWRTGGGRGRSGRWRRDVEERGEGQRGVESGGAGAGAARGVEESGAGAAGARHMANEGDGAAQREIERGESWR
jgi:hypothetical protein